MTRRARTTQDVIDQILATARLERVDWLEAFLTHSQIKDAAGIREAVNAALTTYGRNTVGSATLFEIETIRTPKQVSFAGGDHKDCAAFAIALAISLGLPYELSVREGGLWLYVVTTQILPRPVK